MRRVTIKEAASVLGVDEEAVKAQVKSGQLVACQDTQYQGHVWLRDTIDAPPARKSTRKPPAAKGRSKAPVSGDESQAVKKAEEGAEPAPPPKSKSKSEEDQRRPRTSQRAQEVQLLQEVVAMLKEEISSKNQQLELKDAEIEARREEVKGLLAILNQTRALPAPANTPAWSTTDAPSRRSAFSLALEIFLSWPKRTWLYLRRLIPRLKGHPVVNDEIRPAAREYDGA